MAVYKVPQDVEAEDKLLGPFSFKQFIFLIIATAAGAMAFGLAQILVPLAIIPLPIMIFFGALALPLRKDQPMEVYLAAIISFLLKPRVRLWQPDGVESLIEVTAPKIDESQFGKGYSREEVSQRLSYLANLVDSRGWSVRGVTEPDNSMQADLYNEAQDMNDLLDDGGDRAKKIDDLLIRANNERRQQIMTQMQSPQPVAQPITQQAATPQPTAIPEPQTQNISQPYTPMSVVQPQHPDEDIQLVVNPYPKMNQSVITPLSEAPPVAAPTHNQTPPQPTHAQQQPAPAPASSKEAVSPAIIDLAKNHDGLSVATLQREAERVKKKELESEEVVISLR